jgi:hypothetical protein
MIITKKKYKNKYSKKLLKGGSSAIPKTDVPKKTSKTRKVLRGLSAAITGTAKVGLTLPQFGIKAVKAVALSPYTYGKATYHHRQILGMGPQVKENLEYKNKYHNYQKVLEQLHQKEEEISKDSSITDKSAALQKLRNSQNLLEIEKHVSRGSVPSPDITVPGYTKDLLARLQGDYELRKKTHNNSLNQSYKNTKKAYNNKKRQYNSLQNNISRLKTKYERYKKYVDPKKSSKFSLQLGKKLSELEIDIHSKESEIQTALSELKKTSEEIRKQDKKTFEGSIASLERKQARKDSTVSTFTAPFRHIRNAYKNTYESLKDPNQQFTNSLKLDKLGATGPINYLTGIVKSVIPSIKKQSFNTPNTGRAFYKSTSLRNEKSLARDIDLLSEGLKKQQQGNINTTKTKKELERIKQELLRRQSKNYKEFDLEKKFNSYSYGLPGYEGKAKPEYNQFKNMFKNLSLVERKQYLELMKQSNPIKGQYEAIAKIYKYLNIDETIEKIEVLTKTKPENSVLYKIRSEK